MYFAICLQGDLIQPISEVVSGWQYGENLKTAKYVHASIQVLLMYDLTTVCRGFFSLRMTLLQTIFTLA